ncbi:hypothetical protein K435DRAFT_868665 [Dendrothele bispora CBS 962.96]|uniref:Uncharacterized protein n=1 Tax=Dendrothele bispora (strain CBS 962.96) TaxID=1314807 RepID=A0A4S8LB41_DENBC|nr:hypothetical protein K435DRAFT_868665 [Dendrothele bispora CBS 962.96]
MPQPNLTIKREREAEDDIEPKRKRVCTANTNVKNENLFRSGGYFDTQTSDTQYFGFSQSDSTGIHATDRLESQNDFGENDDDNYLPQSQLELEEDFDYPQSQIEPPYEDEDEGESQFTGNTEHLASITGTVPVGAKLSQATDHQSSLSNVSFASHLDSQDHEWGPGSVNQEKLDRILHIKYGDPGFLYNIVDQRTVGEDAKHRWRIMKEEETDNHAPRLALFRLLRDAGITDSSDGFSRLNPLRKGHIMAASYLIRIASKLICHGGQAQDTEVLRDAIEDGRIFLNIANELVDKEDKARDWIANE